MAKAKYFTQNKEKIYPISHTKAVYDGNGKVLEDRLTEDETAISSLQTDVKGKADKTDVDNKLSSNSAISDTTVAFTEASARENIVSNEKTSTLFGKTKKWFSDLKKVAFTGSYNDLTDIPSNQIFVQCDGDHDELKLQAAISTAPYNSVIYPVGTKCVLTNENTIRGYGLPESSGRAIISLKGGMTLDGSMCDTIMFKNTNPAEKQYIFHLPGNAILKNVKFCEDTDTVTADTVNPAVLYASSDSKIMHCIFYDIFGTHQFSIPTFKFGTVLFAYNDISSFNGAPANNLTNEITFGSNSVIVGNTFNDITQKEQSLGNMLVVNRSLFQNNYMGGFDNCNITLSGSVVGNIIKLFDDCSIKITGEFVANDISVVTQNTKTSFLSTTPYTIISGNVMKSISIENEYINIIECSSYAVISDNYFYVGSIPATGECALIWSTQQNIISDNIFRTGTSVKDNSDFAIIDGDGNTMVKDNLTNATSLGTFEDTCVVEGNVTGGNA